MATDPHNTPHPPADPPKLLAGYFNGTLDAELLAELEQWVRADPANADTFARYAIEQRALENALKHDRVGDLADLTVSEFDVLNTVDPTELELVTSNPPDGSSAIGFVIDQALAERRKHDIEDEANRRLAAQQAEDARNRRYELRRQAEPEPVQRVIVIPKAVAWLGFAAVIGFLLSIPFLTANSQPKNTPPAAEVQPETDSQPRAMRQPVAHVGRSLEAHWSESTGYQLGAEIFAGDTVRLDSGFLELHTASGSVVMLEGPCEIVAASNNRVTLRHGRLVAHATGPTERFTVSTPRGDVVDLGTVFGVEVGDDRSANVAVFDGLVEVYSNDSAESAATAVPVREGRMARMSQTGNESVVLTALDQATDAMFARTLEQAESSAFRYRRAVLASGPAAYWTFDGQLRTGTQNFAQPGSYDLKSNGFPVNVPGVFGQAVSFNNHRAPYSYLELTEQGDPFDPCEDFTIELWFKSDHLAVGTLINLFPAAPESAQLTMALIELQDNLPATVVGEWRAFAVRGLHRDPPSNDGMEGANLYSDENYTPRQWHHIVLVKGSGMLRLFMDGQPVGAYPDDTHLANPSLLTIGVNSAIKDPGSSSIRPFSGQIDEAAIYHRALTEQEIAEHYHLAGMQNR